MLLEITRSVPASILGRRATVALMTGCEAPDLLDLAPIGTICLYLTALHFEIHNLCPGFPETLYNPPFWILFFVRKCHCFTWYSDIGNFGFPGVSIEFSLELGWWIFYYSFQGVKIYSFDFSGRICENTYKNV